MATNSPHLSFAGSTNGSPFLHLPTEIISQIASHLSNKDIHSCLLLHRSISIHFLSLLWRTIDFKYVSALVNGQSPRVVRFKHAAIETGALSRNGRFIRSIKAVPVNWLVKYFGPHVCPFLETLEIYQFNIDGDYNNGLAEADMTTLSAYLQQISSYGSNTLQKLVLSIFEGHPKHLRMDAFPDVLKAIPNSVQELHLDGLYSWREVEREPYYLKSYAEKFRIADQYFQKFCNLDLLARRDHSATTAIVTSAPQESLASHGQSALRNDGSHSLSLPGITKLVFENLSAYFEDVAPLIQACSNLESISFFGCNIDRPHDFTQLLRTNCPRLSSLSMSRRLEHRFGFASAYDLFLPLCASVGGWKTLAFSYCNGFVIPENFKSGLLHHANTIENLYFYRSHWKSKDMHEFLCSALRLKRFMVVENSNESINTSSIQDIDMRDWACTGLEVFRTSIHSIPRPDLDSQALSMTTMREVTLEESHRIQRLHYRQLGRLTKLKELVLGEFELDELKEMTTLYEEEDMEIQKHIAFGRGKDCLAMTLESGMDLLKDLSQLRRVGLRGLQVPGFMASERDREWIKEHWPLMDNNYRGCFTFF